MMDTRGVVATYQLSFCVSGAIARSTFSFSAHNVSLLLRELREAYHRDAVCQSSRTEVIDVEDAADGTTRPAVLDLALCRRSRGVVDGRIDLAEGLGDDLCCRHGWCWSELGGYLLDGVKAGEADGCRRTISWRLVRYTSLMEKCVQEERREKQRNQLHVIRAHQAIARMLLGGRGGHAGLVTWC
jgi:hypothetical protein